jgi:hypothetical protein
LSGSSLRHPSKSTSFQPSRGNSAAMIRPASASAAQRCSSPDRRCPRPPKAQEHVAETKRRRLKMIHGARVLKTDFASDPGRQRRRKAGCQHRKTLIYG